MSFLIRTLTIVCVGTCVTQMILLGYFASRGTVNTSTITKVIALANGIDISGQKLRQVLSEAEDREQPDFDEILEARKRENLDIDMRMRSINERDAELTAKEAELQAQQTRFDDRRGAFDRRLNQIRDGVEEDGLKEVQRTLQALEADQSKILLLKIYDDKRIDDVVNIIQAMPIDKRKDILAEFVGEEEIDKLHDILRRIGDGMPTTALIDEARGQN